MTRVFIAFTSSCATGPMQAKPGDIFTPEIAVRFRRLLQPETKEAETKNLILRDMRANLIVDSMLNAIP